MLLQTRATFCVLIAALAAFVSCLPASTPDARAPRADAAALAAEPQNQNATTTAMPSVVVAEYDFAALDSAGAFQSLEKLDAAVVDDPLYKTGERRFYGYRLSEVLSLLDGFADIPRNSHKLVWVCADGYRTTYDFHAIRGGSGILATGLSDRDGRAWESYTRGKMTLLPAPFYLVWEGEGPDNGRPWPYQLTKLQVISSERIAMRLETPQPELHGEGEMLYKKHCMSCHSMNLIGGVMGPEMNVPRNILEYRTAADFVAFAANPQAFRARSPMPKMRHLGEDTLEKITGYVASMSARKVCVTPMACAEYADATK